MEIVDIPVEKGFNLIDYTAGYSGTLLAFKDNKLLGTIMYINSYGEVSLYQTNIVEDYMKYFFNLVDLIEYYKIDNLKLIKFDE